MPKYDELPVGVEDKNRWVYMIHVKSLVDVRGLCYLNDDDEYGNQLHLFLGTSWDLRNIYITIFYYKMQTKVFVTHGGV